MNNVMLHRLAIRVRSVIAKLHKKKKAERILNYRLGLDEKGEFRFYWSAE